MLATNQYGHFTTMRVRDGAVQGLDLHLARLREGHALLFDAGLDEARLRQDLRAVLPACGEQSLRVTAFARGFDYREPLKTVQPEWLLSVGPAMSAASASPLLLKSFAFVRPLPQVKHVATLPLFHYRRQAHKAGCDDALLVDGTHADARVVEGSVWNICFWDGSEIIWPQAAALRGTTEQLLQAGLSEAGMAQRLRPVPLSEASRMQAAFALSVRGLQTVGGIDAVRYAGSSPLAEQLAQILHARAWQPI